MQVHNPSAIVWTEARSAAQHTVFEDSQPYIYAFTPWTWIEREMDLAKIRNLGNNWDGFDADAPDIATLDKAASFLRLLRERDESNPPNRIALSPNGSVALEWVQGTLFLRAEVADSNEVEWMLASPGRPTEFQVESLMVSTSQGPVEFTADPVLTSSSPIVQGQEWKPPRPPVAVGAHA
jgi:hypothetical protein